MKIGEANLRISYVGGGFDKPHFFKQAPMFILTEGLPYVVKCTLNAQSAEWDVPFSHVRGLGSSGARWLSLVRAIAPKENEYLQLMKAIELEDLNHGGWQDVVASSRRGIMLLEFHGKLIKRHHIPKPQSFDSYRHLYRIPVELHDIPILEQQELRDRHMIELAELVPKAKRALENEDYPRFGQAITEGWNLKKSWHPAIANSTIRDMERAVNASGAYGWKVCGAGGQGGLLVIATPKVHLKIASRYRQLF